MRRNTAIFIALTVLTIFAWLYKRYTSKPSGTSQKVLITTSTAKIKGMDPAHGEDMYATRQISRVYEGLLEYHYLKRPLELVPNLAAEMPTISKDGLTYTFKVNKASNFMMIRALPRAKVESSLQETLSMPSKEWPIPKYNLPGSVCYPTKFKD